MIIPYVGIFILRNNTAAVAFDDKLQKVSSKATDKHRTTISDFRLSYQKPSREYSDLTGFSIEDNAKNWLKMNLNIDLTPRTSDPELDKYSTYYLKHQEIQTQNLKVSQYIQKTSSPMRRRKKRLKEKGPHHKGNYYNIDIRKRKKVFKKLL